MKRKVKVKIQHPDKPKLSELKKQRKNTYEWIQCFIFAIIFCVVLFVFFIRVIDVRGTSMLPTLKDGDKMLVSGLMYEPKVGDIVVFKTDTYDPNKALVKRVIAVQDQTINIDFERGIVYVDGEAIEEDYINDITLNKIDFIGPKTVPEGHVFVMGDNRNMSNDSRDSRIGMVDSRLILGKAYMIVYPFNRLMFLK